MNLKVESIATPRVLIQIYEPIKFRLMEIRGSKQLPSATILDLEPRARIASIYRETKAWLASNNRYIYIYICSPSPLIFESIYEIGLDSEESTEQQRDSTLQQLSRNFAIRRIVSRRNRAILAIHRDYSITRNLGPVGPRNQQIYRGEETRLSRTTISKPRFISFAPESLSSVVNRLYTGLAR